MAAQRAEETAKLLEIGMYNFGLSSGSDSDSSVEDDEEMDDKYKRSDEDEEAWKEKKKKHRAELVELRRKEWETKEDDWNPNFIIEYKDVDDVNLSHRYMGGSGLDNGDEEYFERIKAEEEERTRAAREKEREKKELETMRAEERDQRVRI
jgi:hypothetical protein